VETEVIRRGRNDCIIVSTVLGSFIESAALQNLYFAIWTKRSKLHEVPPSWNRSAATACFCDRTSQALLRKAVPYSPCACFSTENPRRYARGHRGRSCRRFVRGCTHLLIEARLPQDRRSKFISGIRFVAYASIRSYKACVAFRYGGGRTENDYSP